MTLAVRLRWMTAAVLLLGACTTAHAPTLPSASPHTAPAESAATTDGDRSADARAQRLQRWHDLGFGMFVHWGLYSELGGVWQGKRVERGYSEQIQSFARIPADDYAAVARRFRAGRFDADAICGLARDAGARYIVVTAKHHDGFAMFDTASTDYNIVDRTPFARDPLKLLSDACRRIGLGFGVYFSLVDWHAGHPFDPDNNNPIPASMEPLIEQQLRELMSNYGTLAEVWFDMSAATPAQSRRFAGIVHALQPDAAINGRIWNNQGDFVTLGDNEQPPASMQPPFEVPASIYHTTWGYRSWQPRSDAPAKVRELLRGLVAARAGGGNYLLNIGPKGDGSIVPFEATVLRDIGAWLARHPGFFDAQPSGLPTQAWGSTLLHAQQLQLYVTQWPRDGVLRIRGLATDPSRVGVDDAQAVAPLSWRRDGDDVVLSVPASAPDAMLPVLRIDLAAPLQAIPANAVALQAGSVTPIPAAAWHDATSFAFGAGYYTQTTTHVARSLGVRGMAGTRFALRLQGVHAAQALRYAIEFDGQTRSVSAQMLERDAIGPFVMPASGIGTLRLRLQQPAYPAQDMVLTFDSAQLTTMAMP